MNGRNGIKPFAGYTGKKSLENIIEPELTKQKLHNN
jgi:hypothetical protein